jgi:ABC-2 type transport system ATP-binding protein
MLADTAGMANTRRAEPASSGAALPSCPTRAVRVRHLCRSFSSNSRRRPSAGVAALTDVNLEVRAGEVHGLLGPNGAGKTTLCRILATVLLPNTGSAEVFGFDVVTHVRQVRRRIGIVFGGDRGLYPRLTARQNLHFWAALYGVPGPARTSLAERLLTRVGLAERAEEAGPEHEVIDGGIPLRRPRAGMAVDQRLDELEVEMDGPSVDQAGQKTIFVGRWPDATRQARRLLDAHCLQDAHGRHLPACRLARPFVSRLLAA